MSLRVVPIVLMGFALLSCGVKSNLERPMGQVMQPQNPTLQNPQKDPSRPPTPLGEPGGTTPPYTTGP
jgi:hypothetical protein